MSTTITIRADEALRRQLEDRAAATGKSLSALVREILEESVKMRPLGRRAGHLKGRLSLPDEPSDSQRASIRHNNWRP